MTRRPTIRNLRWITIALGLAACATSAPVSHGVLFRADDWPAVLDQGFAVAPFVPAHPVTGGIQGTSEFTREFFVALQGTSPGTPLMGPDDVFRVLDEEGPSAQSRLRAVRRSAYRKSRFDANQLATLSRDAGQRYLLVGWMDEGTAEGLQKTVKDDLNAFNYSMHVHGYSTEEIHGRVTAVVIDLQEAREVWRGATEYETGWLDWDEPSRAEAEIFRTRAAAAIDLASLLGAPGAH